MKTIKSALFNYFFYLNEFRVSSRHKISGSNIKHIKYTIQIQIQIVRNLFSKFGEFLFATSVCEIINGYARGTQKCLGNNSNKKLEKTVKIAACICE